MKETPKAETNKLAYALVIVGLLCAFALGFMTSDLVKGGGPKPAEAPKSAGPVQVVMTDGSTLGGRLNNLEKSVKGMVEQTKQAVGEGRLMDLTALPTRFLDLSNSGRFAATGPEKATVTLVEFSDFQCPYCGRMAMMLEELMKKNPDQVRLIFVDRPLTSKYKDGYPFHPFAMTAHEAAAEARAQGKFWEMYHYIFQNQQTLFPEARPTSQQDYDEKLAKLRDQLVQVAGTLGLDQAKMKQALEGHTYQAELEKSVALAEKMQIFGTPTVFVSSFFSFPEPASFQKLLDARAKIE